MGDAPRARRAPVGRRAAAWALAAIMAAGCSGPPAAAAPPSDPSAAQPKATQAGTAGRGTRRAAPLPVSARVDALRSQLGVVSARIDTVSSRLDSAATRLGRVDASVRQLNAAVWRGGVASRLLWLLAGLALGAAAAWRGLPRLAGWRQPRGGPDAPLSSSPPPASHTGDTADPPGDTQHAAAADTATVVGRAATAQPPAEQGNGYRAAAGSDTTEQRLRALEQAVRELAKAAERTERTVRAEFGGLAERLAAGGPRGGAARPGRTGTELLPADTGPSRDLRDLHGAAPPRDRARERSPRAEPGGSAERCQAQLNEEGVFIAYPEPVNRPMAELSVHARDGIAFASISSTFSFGLDSRRLQIAFDVDQVDSGRYQTLRPARVDWSHGEGRGLVLDKGQLRYIGT